MSLFDHSIKSLEYLPDLKKEKKLSNILGTSSLLNRIRSLPSKDLGSFRGGAAILALIFGSIAYYNYRREYQNRYLMSSGIYKLLKSKMIDGGDQFIWGGKGPTSSLGQWYYRMPKKEYDISYRLRPAFLSGEFDHTKEVLIPFEKDGVEGYNVITPFYYFIWQSQSQYVGVLQNGKLHKEVDNSRSALAVNRGWIPAGLKDRRLRPHDQNTGKQEVIYGTIKRVNTKKHDFSTPNDPSRNYWNNFSLEDLVYYWDLPNKLDSKFCFFHQVDLEGIGVKNADVFPQKSDPVNVVIQDQKEDGVYLDRPYNTYKKISAALTGFACYLFYLSA